MNTVQRSRAIMVLLIFTAFFILGSSSPKQNSDVEAQAWETLTISATGCVPLNETYEYQISAAGHIDCDENYCAFICPVTFPTASVVRVKRFSLLAYDDSPGNINASLWKAKPVSGTAVVQATVVSTNSASNPAKRTDTSIASISLSSQNDSYIVATIDLTDKKIYGFEIKYTIIVP